MANGSCLHNWCDRSSSAHITDSETHESRMVGVAGLNDMEIGAQVSYRDGEHAPTLWVADVQLTEAGVAELIAVLQEQRQIMTAVQTLRALAARAA